METKAKTTEFTTADPAAVLTGAYYLDGNYAAAEGALAAGCRFSAGYPITPSTEVVERFASRIPKIGGEFIQMEDEIASSIAILGAVWAGAKAMTVTSGPGFSLMMEHIGLAVMMEVPCVFINVQRTGPSTGLPTKVGQGDMMQVRWGSHGDFAIIALTPESPQEAFDLTIRAFNLAEEYRVPVFVMMDECVGHMTEKVVIPKAEEIKIFPRKYTKLPPGQYFPYRTNGDLVPEMIKVGDGYRIHTTGLTHDERGYPDMSVKTHQKLLKRLVDKIKLNADKIISYQETDIDDADCIVVSYGISARVASYAVQMARKEGLKVGVFRLITVWPFPEKRMEELAKKIKSFVVIEINFGQIFYEVDRLSRGNAKTYMCPHAGGDVHDPEEILKVIKESLK